MEGNFINTFFGALATNSSSICTLYNDKPFFRCFNANINVLHKIVCVTRKHNAGVKKFAEIGEKCVIKKDAVVKNANSQQSSAHPRSAK